MFVTPNDLERYARELHGTYRREANEMARRMTMDFTGEEEFGDFPPFLSDMNGPAGIYGGQITRVEDGESRAKDPLMKVWWKILWGPLGHPAMNQFNGSAITQQVSFHPNAKGAVMHFLHMIGEPYQGQVQIDLDRWINRKCRIQVIQEIPDGYDKTFWNVKGNLEWRPGDEKLASVQNTPAANMERRMEPPPAAKKDPGTGDTWDPDDIPF